MRTPTFLLTTPLLVLASLPAQPQSTTVPADEQKGYATITQDELRSDVTYLAQDRLQGRMSLQPGDDLAVRWIAGQFAKAGLDPGAIKANGMPSYEQSFDVVEYRPDRAATAITMMRAGKPTVWHAPDAFGAYKHAVDITAPVVFVGYGITAPELHYDDYAGIDVKGRIVLAFDHEPQEDNAQSVFNGTGNTRYATTRVKLLNAQAHGAIALVLVAEPNRKHLTNAERAARIGGSVTRATPLPLQAIAEDEVNIPAITVLDDVAKELLATSGSTGSELQAKIDADLKPQSRELPDTALTVHLHNVSEVTSRTSNVVGLLKGGDDRLKAETIILSAHHDHDGQAPCEPGTAGVNQEGQPIPAGADCMQIWHGADDNASGTAGVVALARAFTANGARPRRSVLFVVFAAEERGLLGSYWMAAHPVRPLATTRAMINFDMIGRDEQASPQTDGLIEVPAETNNRLNLIGTYYSPMYRSVVLEENYKVGLVLDDRFDRDSALNVLFRSDQFPFLLKNIPAFWWFTGFHPDYHHVTDTADKIDYAKMAKILDLAYLSAWRFGTDDTVPKFIANPGAPPPPPPPPAAAAATPAAAAPALRHHRPLMPVNIQDTTGEGAAPAQQPPSAGPLQVPVPAPVQSPAVASPSPAPSQQQPATVITATPVVATPPPPPIVSAPDAAPAPAVAAPAAADTPKPRRRRPITPVTIVPTTGIDGGNPYAPKDDDQPADAVQSPVGVALPTVQPTAPGKPAAVAPTTVPGGAATPPPPDPLRPPVAPVVLNAPASSAAAPKPATPPVTPVKLGGKQPGQDEYEDPQ